jgi:hypothetical protein
MGKAMNRVIQSVNVSATLKAMEVGGNVFFNADVNENTIRNACVRLKSTIGGAWSVDKIGKKGFMVKRIA